MASMNNWLAFSLSPEPHRTHQSPTAVSQLISGDDISADCFGPSTESASDSPLGISTLTDAPFGILEAFNRTHHQPQDWNIKSLDFKGSSSKLSMLAGSGSNRSDADDNEPKFEDFLGGPPFSHNDQNNMFSNYSLQLPAAAMVRSRCGNGGLMNNSSMDKNYNSIGEMVRNAKGLTNSQSLSLSMSTGSQSSSSLPHLAAGASGAGESLALENKKGSGSGEVDGKGDSKKAVPGKSNETFGQRTSIYRGVTRHRWTGRYEAHLWDNSCRREGQTRKGRQVYLGGYDKEEKAARSYDLAALKYWGSTTTTNFPISNYQKEIEEKKDMTRLEYVASLRRKSSGFSRGASIYRGVTRHHQHGRWQARIGRVAGNKDLYLGTFTTQEAAAEAYDIAAIKFRGLTAVTNFEMSRYDVSSILESSSLPIGAATKRLKDASEASINAQRTDNNDCLTTQLTDGISSYGWPTTIAFQPQQPLSIHYPFSHQSGRCKQEDDGVAVAPCSLQDVHNFFQPSVLHNLMSLDSTLLELSMGSNSVVYNGSVGGSSGSYQGVLGAGGFVMADQIQADEGIENILGSSDPYKSAYSLSQQFPVGVIKANNYEESSSCITWLPASAQAVCHGAPLFTVWDES